jgi:hypothetical protein
MKKWVDEVFPTYSIGHQQQRTNSQNADMKTFSFDPATIGTDHIFPPEIHCLDSIGYHGTSTYLSQAIETTGLSCVKPITKDEFSLLKELAAELNYDFRPVSDHFLHMATISLSPLSEMALHYTCPGKLGGQNRTYVKELVDQILSHPDFDRASDGAVRLRSINAAIAAVRQGSPVVYAVDLRGQPNLRYDVLAQAIQVSSPIGKDRILAKVEARDFTRYDLIDCGRLRQHVEILERGPKDHFIKHI